MRSALALSVCLAVVAAGAAFACSSFDEPGASPDGSDASTEAIAPDGSTAPDGGPSGDAGPNVIACDAAAPAPEHVATDATGIDDIAADATHVYWGSKIGKHVRRVAIGGTQVDTVVADAGAASAIGLTTSNVYWITDYLSVAAKGVDSQGQARDLSTTASLLAASGTSVLYATPLGVQELDEPNNPYTKSYQGGPPTALAYGGSTLSFVGPADGGTLIFIGPGSSGPRGLVAADVKHLANDDSTIWMAVPSAGEVTAVAVGDGGRSAVATNQVGLGKLVAADGDLFFSTSGGVRRVAKSGGCVADVSDAPSPAIAVTAEWVYIVRAGTELVRVHR